MENKEYKSGFVALIGRPNVGKSTLINAVLGIEKAKTGYGISGTTNELEIYESDSVPFRVIDTIGFEPTFFKEQKAINAVKKPFGGDGEELDSYVLGIYEPLETFTGKCIAIIHRTNDNDDKLVVVPENKTFTNEEIKVLTDFQEQYFESIILRPKDYINWNKNIPELSVTNLEDSLKFYKMASFKVEYDKPEDKFAFISLGNIQFMLQELSDNDKWDVGELKYPFGNGINFQLEVDYLDEIYNNFKENNYAIAFDIEENWYRQDDKMLGNKEFLIQDPDGYLLRFTQDLGEKAEQN